MKTRRAVDAICIEQCHGGHAEPYAHCHHLLRQRRTFEETESRAGMKLDVHQFSFPGSQFSVKSLSTLESGGFPLRTENWELGTGNCIFSHTCLPQTILPPADRAPVGIEQLHLHFAKRCPTHRAPRLPAPTSRRNCARGLPSKAQCPVLLFFSCRLRVPVLRFPKSQRHARADGTCAEPQWRICLYPLQVRKSFALDFPPLPRARSAASGNLQHGACPTTPENPRELRRPGRQCVPELIPVFPALAMEAETGRLGQT